VGRRRRAGFNRILTVIGRLRRVKCDEQKPNCLRYVDGALSPFSLPRRPYFNIKCSYRCTSTGRHCDGYAQQGDAISSQRQSLATPVRLQHGSVSTLWTLSDNVHYLEFYYHCTSRYISTTMDREFWSRTTLQLAYSESCIRHSLIALGYLYRTGQSGSLKHARSKFLLSDREERRTLLFHYNKAIRCLIDRMAEPSYYTEIGLVACLLFMCIEFFRGNYHPAFGHLKSGLKIISDWRLNKNVSRTPLDRSGQKTDSIVATSAENTTVTHKVSSMIEDELTPIFARMLTTALLYGPTVEKFFRSPSHTPQETQWRSFANMLEAQHSNYELRNLSVSWLRNMGEKAYFGIPPAQEDLQYWETLMDRNRAWLRDLEAIENDEKVPLSLEDRITASALRMSHYCLYIALSCGLPGSTQLLYDDHLASFQTVLHHAESILDFMKIKDPPLPESNSSLSPSHLISPSLPPSHRTTALNSSIARSHQPASLSATTFTFDSTLIVPLYYVAAQCRCPATRRQAVSMLSLDLPREGLLDAQQYALVMQRVIEIEESEVFPLTHPRAGWPVERARLWTTFIDGDMDEEGRFRVEFAGGKEYFEGEGRVAFANGEGRMWREWFVMPE
jgi:hypothetical protein